MPFRLRRDTRKWFEDVKSAFVLDFDMYYLCLMAGLAERRKEDAPFSATTDLVDDFPGVYRPKGRLVIALFLNREIKWLGVKLNERETLHSEIEKLVDPLSASHLSEAGMKEINRYSFGGFDVLSQDWFDDRPRNIETFLPLYKRQLDAALARSP
jgi:hypothetical protein